MDISAEGLGKRYGNAWIFRRLAFRFVSGGKFAILGRNGSGKSTLLRMLAGMDAPTEGRVRYSDGQGAEVPPERWFRYLSYAAPYAELPEELTLSELLGFYGRFKTLTLAPEALVAEAGLKAARDRQIRHFSSGMKQKLKLALALHGGASVVLLDEPTANLDERNAAWYRERFSAPMPGKLLVVCSNVPAEYGFCDETLSVEAFKGRRKPPGND